MERATAPSARTRLAEVAMGSRTIGIPTATGTYDFRCYPFGEFGSELPAALVTEIVEGLSEGVEALGCGLIVCPEPGGNQWGVAVGYRMGLDIVVLRQRLAPSEGEQRITRRTAFYDGDLHAPPLPAGVPVVVVDDVVSSGGTLDAILGHLAASGVAVSGVQAILARGSGFRDVAARHGVPVRSLLVEGAAGEPRGPGVAGAVL